MKTKPVMKISESSVIDRIIELLTLFPELAQMLPAEYCKKTFWKKTFEKNREVRQIVQTLCELPLFTSQAPSKGTRKVWEKVLEAPYGIRSFVHVPGLTVTIQKDSIPLSIRLVAQMLEQIVDVSMHTPVRRKKIRRWRDAFGVNERVQRVHPRESSDYLHNPHRGTTTFQRFQGDDTYPAWITSDRHGPTEFKSIKNPKENIKYIPGTTLTYCRWPWRWLEPRKGKYNWSIIDNTLKTARERGQTAQIRIQPYTSPLEYADEPIHSKVHPPERSVNVPDWYWETGAGWIDRGMFSPNEPDSNDPGYIKHFGDFIKAFARRYDGHPDLESIDVAYAGFWGEAGGNATNETGQKLSDIFLDHFKKTQLLTMLGTSGATHAAAVAKGRKHTLGWRADCFGDLRWVDVPEVPRHLCFNHSYDTYPRELYSNGMADQWKTAPVVMETCCNVATWFMNDRDLDFIMDQGYKYHMSVFMPKNAFIPERFLKPLIEFDKKIGYRFVLRQMMLPLEARAGSRMDVEVFIDNVGLCTDLPGLYLCHAFYAGQKTSHCQVQRRHPQMDAGNLLVQGKDHPAKRTHTRRSTD